MMDRSTDAQQKLINLIAQRDILEIEADALHSELAYIKALPGATLVDSEGFPRGDIDIVNALEKRQRIAIINTDHKVLMKEIEKLIKVVHQEVSEQLGPPMVTPPPDKRSEIPLSVFSGLTASSSPHGFAVIDEVVESSPAMAGGLLIGDIILSFGSVTPKGSSNPLSLIPGVVQEHVNKPIPLLISRSGSVVELSITPAVWSGRGLLGCHLKPL